MGFRRYVAPSAREALERIRKELGPEAVILSNRKAGPGRVEIIAAAPGHMQALVDDFEPAPAPAAAPVARARRPETERPRPAPAARAAPESFQEFIRRQSSAPAPRPDAIAMYQAVAEEDFTHGASFAPAPPAPRPAPQVRPAPVRGEAPAVFRRRPTRLEEPIAPAFAAPVPPLPAAAPPPTPAPVATAPAAAEAAPAALPAAPPAPVPPAPPATAVAVPAPVPPPAQAPAPPPAPTPAPSLAPDARVMAELQALRSVLSDRINHLEARIAPIAAASQRPAAPVPVSVAAAPAAVAAAPAPASAKRQALTRLIMSGFSPELARRLSETVPRDLDPKATDAWLQSAVGRQIGCPEEADNPLFAPGAVALVGPTGVGKTTTIAKLAARFVVRHGAAALGLITLDSYRIGAHEQLRSYGRILGVPVQSAHDAASLRELLATMHGKHQVLIDTCGMSQRDQRLAELLAMLDEVRHADRKIRRVLLINAASHAETIDEVARAWRIEATHGAVLTKIDEAARIGGALDAMMRFRLPLLGLTNGQRVPEDWHPGNPLLLAHIALKPFGAAFCLDRDEIEALSGTGVLLA